MATSLAQEDINYLRLAGLLLKIASRAVRRRFDYEFDPLQLQQFLRKHRCKIDDLTYKKKIITQAQYNKLYPRGKFLEFLNAYTLSCKLYWYRDKMKRGPICRIECLLYQL